MALPVKLNNVNSLDENLKITIFNEISKKSEKAFETKSKIPHAPSHYFEHSEFWHFADKGAMEDWTYCFSKLRSQEEIFSHIYIGTKNYALVNHLVRGDYEVKPNTYYEKHDPSYHLKLKLNKAEEWSQLQTEELGLRHPQIVFTRIITVIKNQQEENELKAIVETAEKESPYASVKKHEYVQLLDLPKNDVEKQQQSSQWNALVGRLDTLFEVLDQAREQKENCLVHCTAGRHRSVAIVVAYLVHRLRLPVQDIQTYVCRKRGCAVDYSLSEFFDRIVKWSETKT